MTIPITTPGALSRAQILPIAAIAGRLVIAGALALLVFGLSVPAASAGESQEIATEGGSVVFAHRGERLLAYDERRDGYGVGAFLTWIDDVGQYHQEKVIDGRSSGGPARRNLSVPEGTTVSLSMCYTKHGDAVAGKCSLEQHAEA